MFDVRIRKIIDPSLKFFAVRTGLTKIQADRITVFGFAVGVLACVMLAFRLDMAALTLLLLNRLCDGLDGIVARENGTTDKGGYLDIVLDFIFYSGYVFAFALRSPETAILAAYLIFSFVGTGTSFLAYAIFEHKSGVPPITGGKAFRYIGGITEGAETIAVFILFTLYPSYFPIIALIYGTLCWITATMRILAGAKMLSNQFPEHEEHA